MYKKILSFLISFYVINIVTYFIVWRGITLRSYDRLSVNPEFITKIEEKGMSIDTIKQSFLTTDTQIFNPFFNIGFYFSNWKFIPSILLSSLIVYLIHRNKTKI